MEHVLVSIIICTYNAASFLIESIGSACAQDHADIEIIVVDDGSTDRSLDAAREAITDPRVRWLRQSNAGKAVALNRALNVARGEFYIIQDADDTSHPARVTRLLAGMRMDQQAAAVFSGHHVIIDGRPLAPRTKAKSWAACKRDVEQMRLPAHDATGVYRRSMVGDLRFDESLRIGQGYDYILRVGERWPMIVIGECLYGYRIHPKSITRADPARRDALIEQVYRRACGRRGIDYDKWSRQRLRRRRRTGRNSVGVTYGMAAHFIESVVDQRREGQFVGAVRTGWQCVWLQPARFDHYKAMMYALAPPPLLRRMRPEVYG